MNDSPMRWNLSRLLLSCCLAAWLLGPIAVLRAEPWPQWRGPRGNGTSRETGLPTTWSRSENMLWRVPLPGPAGSTPAVWGDRIFLTSVDDDDLVLLCFTTDGKPAWRDVLGGGGRVRYRSDEGNNASPSPSTDGKHVWACTSNGLLVCDSVDGKRVWKIDLQERYGPYEIQFGMSSTPLLHQGRLYLQILHGKMDRTVSKNSWVVCLDAATGKELWKQPRNTDAIMENKHSYASPVLYQDDRRSFLLTHGADYIIAHRLTDGRELWRCDGINGVDRPYNPFLRLVASPATGSGVIVVPSAKNGPVLCLKPDGTGDRTNDSDSYYWKWDRGTPDVPSPLIHDGLVYLLRENGNLSCVDAKSGRRHYFQQPTERGRHRASPVYADGKIFTVARNTGTVCVIQAGTQFKILARNRLGEPMASSPAISGGRIYLRTFSALYAIGTK